MCQGAWRGLEPEATPRPLEVIIKMNTLNTEKRCINQCETSLIVLLLVCPFFIKIYKKSKHFNNKQLAQSKKNFKAKLLNGLKFRLHSIRAISVFQQI